MKVRKYITPAVLFSGKKKLGACALACLLVLSASGAMGQERIGVRQGIFELDGDSVRVEMEVSLNGTMIPAQSFVLLTPVLQSSNFSMELPAVLINGKGRRKSYKRLQALDKEIEGIQLVINAPGLPGDVHRYRVAVPYEPWMSESEFKLREDQCECNGLVIPMSFELLARHLEGGVRPAAPVAPVAPAASSVSQYVPQLAVSYVVPEVEKIKMRSESGKAYLDFPVGQSVIQANFMNNRFELNKIHEMIGMVKSNPDATIIGITIEGYASPEGNYQSNQVLSERRARALKDHLQTFYGLPESMFSVRGFGEDWYTLDSLVSVSPMYDKYNVLTIIRGGGNYDQRENRLKALDGGQTYRGLFDQFYPQLRRSDYELSYTVLPFTVEKGKEVIKTHPSSLSLNEMFLIAQTYEKGSNQFNAVFETAARVFPQSDVANLNAAASALSRKDTSSALRYLGRIRQQTAAYYNNLGVLYFLQGDRRKASECFAQGRAEGNPEALDNFNELNNR